ncbi:hypothetical protein ACH5RR_015558 [Cinchona calisaya]|uniref:Uncharacterized protein n=1 Tax=Cinchona calisaya TaxID=153742 RepID=A0ABD2ZUC6_9GENT
MAVFLHKRRNSVNSFFWFSFLEFLVYPVLFSIFWFWFSLFKVTGILSAACWVFLNLRSCSESNFLLFYLAIVFAMIRFNCFKQRNHPTWGNVGYGTCPHIKSQWLMYLGVAADLGTVTVKGIV